MVGLGLSFHQSECVFSKRNVYSEPSKADDVQFTLDLIAKVGEEIPAADMDNVNIIGRYHHHDLRISGVSLWKGIKTVL